jgi:hypothetical protein
MGKEAAKSCLTNAAILIIYFYATKVDNMTVRVILTLEIL